MIGIRNVIVHSYQQLDLDIMIAILEHHGDDLIAFSNLALRALEV
ncbi:MAG: HepT-like ribonuclease domain-containing protein [Opitutales bacterium]